MPNRVRGNIKVKPKAAKARLTLLIKVLLVLCALVFAALAVLFAYILMDRGKAPAPEPAAEVAGPVDPALLGRWIEERSGYVIAFFEGGKADSFHPFAGNMRSASYSAVDGQLMLSGGGVDAAFTYEVAGSELQLIAGEGGFAFEELTAQEGEAMVFYEFVGWIEEDSGVPIPSAARADLSEMTLSGASMPELIEFIEGIERASG